MKPIAEIDFSTLSLCDLFIILSSKIRSDFSHEMINAILTKKVEEALDYVAVNDNEEDQIKRLLDLFYCRWGFRGTGGVCSRSESLWLDNVFEKKRGLGVSLGILLLHFAKHLNLPLTPVMFCGQLILRFDKSDGETDVIDPFNGETLDVKTLELFSKSQTDQENTPLNFDVTSPGDIVKQILNMLKTALVNERETELALKVSQILLQIYPNDPYEIRDRGLIYARLDCEHQARADLNYFVQHCPEDPLSQLIKFQLDAVEQKQIVLH